MTNADGGGPDGPEAGPAAPVGAPAGNRVDGGENSTNQEDLPERHPDGAGPDHPGLESPDPNYRDADDADSGGGTDPDGPDGLSDDADYVGSRRRSQESGSISREIDVANLAIHGGVAVFGGRIDGGVTGSVGVSQVSATASGMRCWQVSTEILTALAWTFVPSSAQEFLSRTVKGRRVAVLRAVEGWGRSTAALCALHQLGQAEEAGSPPLSDGEPAPNGRDPHRGDDPRAVYRLDIDPGIELHRFDPSSLPRRAALLLEDPPQGLRTLGASQFEIIRSVLARIDSYLIVTVRTGAVLAEDLGDLVVEGSEPPSPLAVLARHLAHRTRTDPDATYERLDRIPKIAEIIGETTQDGPHTAAIANLAELLARWGEQDAGLERVAEAARQHSAAGLHSWLAQLSPGEFGLAVALAVVNGLPYRELSRVAARLTAGLHDAGLVPAHALPLSVNQHTAGPLASGQPDGAVSTDLHRGTAEPGATPLGTGQPGAAGKVELLLGGPRLAGGGVLGRPSGSGWLGPGRSEVIARIRAEAADFPEQTGHGVVHGEGIRYVDDTYPRRVLEWVWREHVDVQPVILAWIRELCTDRSFPVRIRAATAAGLISTFDFDTVRRQLWLTWSESDTRQQRVAVVAGLRVPSATPELADHVGRMLSDWCAHTRSPWRLWTAARAWGAAVGRGAPARALAALTDLAAVPEPPSGRPGRAGGLALHRAVSQSVFELFEGADVGIQQSIVDLLAAWVTDDEPRRRRAGVLCFIQLVYDATAVSAVKASHAAPAPDVRLTDASSEVAPWPALPALVYQGDVDAETVGLLLNSAVNTYDLRDTALAGLRSWYAIADRDARLTPALQRILQKTIYDDQDLDLFMTHIRAWHRELPDITRALAETIDLIAEPAR